MEFSNAVSSDKLIYDILSSSDDSVVSRHMICFPTPLSPEDENDCIFVTHLTNEYDRQTNESDHFLVTVELLITNRNTDYELANEAINLCIKHIKKIIRSNNEIKKRQLRILNSETIYGDDNLLRRNLILQLNEMDIYDQEYEFNNLNILFGEIELNV